MPAKKLIVILDRDGVLIHNNQSMKDGPYYVMKPEQVTLKDGVKEGLDELRNLGAFFGMVTKQNCVSKGLCTPIDVEQVNFHMAMALPALSRPPGFVSRVYWGASDNIAARVCAITSVLYEYRHICPMMAGEVDQRQVSVWVIDDSLSGIIAAHKLGCRTIWIKNPYSTESGNTWAEKQAAEFEVDDFAAAVRIIKKCYSSLGD